MFVIGFEKAANEPLRLRRRFHSFNCAFASLLVSQIAQRKAAQTLEAARAKQRFLSRKLPSLRDGKFQQIGNFLEFKEFQYVSMDAIVSARNSARVQNSKKTLAKKGRRLELKILVTKNYAWTT